MRGSPFSGKLGGYVGRLRKDFDGAQAWIYSPGVPPAAAGCQALSAVLQNNKPSFPKMTAAQIMARAAPPKIFPTARRRSPDSTCLSVFDEIKKVGSFCPFAIMLRS